MVATELSNVAVNESMATVTTVPSRTDMKAAAAITATTRIVRRSSRSSAGVLVSIATSMARNLNYTVQ